MNTREQKMFAHRLSVLIESGISLGEALAIISSMEKSKKRHKIFVSLQQSVERGISLSKSMTATKIRFDQTLLAMIESGENSGTLALSLKEAYEVMEKSSELKKKIIGALIYPALIACATFAMTLFLVMYIFPKIIPLFSSMNITLPFLTRAVRFLYNFSFHYGLWICVILFVFFISFQILYKKMESFRFFFQKMLLFTPFLGECIKKYSVSSTCYSMGMLLDHGQSLSSILLQKSKSTSYGPYKKAWRACYTHVIKGVSLSECIKNETSVFPPLVSNMLFIGEKTGSLSIMLGHIARIYEGELDMFLKQMSTVIEPFLMIGMGLIVGSVALSIILPIYEITNHLSH